MYWGRYDPFEEFMREFERLINEFTPQRPRFGPFDEGYRKPYVELVEEDDKYIVMAEIPGVRKEDIRLRIVDNTLYIEAKREIEKEERLPEGVTRYMSFAGYRTTVRLPDNIVPEKAKARYRNGILEVEIPKKVPTKSGGSEIPIE